MENFGIKRLYKTNEKFANKFFWYTGKTFINIWIICNNVQEYTEYFDKKNYMVYISLNKYKFWLYTYLIIYLYIFQLKNIIYNISICIYFKIK